MTTFTMTSDYRTVLTVTGDKDNDTYAVVYYANASNPWAIWINGMVVGLHFWHFDRAVAWLIKKNVNADFSNAMWAFANAAEGGWSVD